LMIFIKPFEEEHPVDFICISFMEYVLVLLLVCKIIHENYVFQAFVIKLAD
jgi:hypothetical protein